MIEMKLSNIFLKMQKKISARTQAVRSENEEVTTSDENDQKRNSLKSYSTIKVTILPPSPAVRLIIWGVDLKITWLIRDEIIN